MKRKRIKKSISAFLALIMLISTLTGAVLASAESHEHDDGYVISRLDDGSGDVPGHLIINQVFGGGPSDNTGSISHSFVELYNPTEHPVSLAGWSLQVQNGKDNSNAATEWLKYDFDEGDAIPAYTSF